MGKLTTEEKIRVVLEWDVVFRREHRALSAGGYFKERLLPLAGNTTREGEGRACFMKERQDWSSESQVNSGEPAT